MFNLVIFDFDGTLADSFPFFSSVYNDLAREHGFRTVAAHEVEALRRLGAREIMRHVGMPVWKLPVVAGDFVGRMRGRRDAVQPFPGVVELLQALDRSGVQTGIVSSNAEDNVRAILGPASNAVRHYACGMSIFGKRAHLGKILRRSGIANAATIYIGDQITDLEAAHGEAIAFGAVAWGYGNLEHLKSAGADYAFQDVAEMTRILESARAGT